MQMTNAEAGESMASKPYDLEERTGRFGETIIAFAKRIPVNLVTSTV